MDTKEASEEKPKFNFATSNKKASKRYFEEDVETDLEKIRLKPKSKQKFEGEIIQVNQTDQKPYLKHWKNRKFNNDKHKFVNKKPRIPQELLEKHSRGEKVDPSGVKTKFFKDKQQRKEIYLEYATQQAARTELLLTEQQGFIEPGEDEITAQYKQTEIAKNVDILAASKQFKLKLDFGPYKTRYSKNGRHLLLGGRKGHVAAFDWVTKRLACEMNVMEEVADVAWLHVPTMFACAQKKWTYIYDSKGTELHCIKAMHEVNRMDFLPYHFLLAAGNTNGYLFWLDVSIGELVGRFNTHQGDIRLLSQNPYNGVLCVGSGKGVVSMWSPKVREPLAKMLVHKTPLSALTVDPKGKFMVTAGYEQKLKVWDVRQLNGPLLVYNLRTPANHIEISQRGVLAFSQGNYCEMYSNVLIGKKAKTPYLRHIADGAINSLRFCPYEDVLGVGTENGFESLLVPAAGEANYDALEDNPFQTSKQRREHEVHALLEKIPAELITLDPNNIATVDAPTLQEKVKAKLELFHIKPPKIDFKSRNKMKGKGGSANAAKNKQIVKDQKRKEFISNLRTAKQEVLNAHCVEDEKETVEDESKPSVLDRFKPKKKKKSN